MCYAPLWTVFPNILKNLKKPIDKHIYVWYYNEVEFPKTVGTNV